MKIPTILAYDDLDRVEKGERNQASQTRYVGLDGRWVELDLTPEHEAELLAFIKRYMNAGVTPPEPPKPPRAKGVAGRGPSVSAIERNQRILAFAEQRGLKYTKRKAGGWYFPVATVEAWYKHERDLEAAQDALGSDRASQSADAGDRG